MRCVAGREDPLKEARISLGIVPVGPTTDRRRRWARALVLLAVLSAPSCAGSPFGRRLFEYEEEIYLDVDGTATVNVNASVASLVALRGAPLPVDPQARVDRERVRAFFSVVTISSSTKPLSAMPRSAATGTVMMRSSSRWSL